jgi:hypothetical protein
MFTSAHAHGWVWVALNIFFYGFLCWLAFWCVRGTAGTERVFMVGWFVGLLLSPLETVSLHWAKAITQISAIGLAVAMLAALYEPPSGDSNYKQGTECLRNRMVKDHLRSQPRDFTTAERWAGETSRLHSKPLNERLLTSITGSFLLEWLVNSGVGHATQHCLAGLSLPLLVFRDRDVGCVGSERPVVRGQQRG